MYSMTRKSLRHILESKEEKAMAMLEVRDLQVYYGMIHAIKGISFDVNQGEVIALIGANGAGKTTNSAYDHRTACTKVRIGFI